MTLHWEGRREGGREAERGREGEREGRREGGRKLGERESWGGGEEEITFCSGLRVAGGLGSSRPSLEEVDSNFLRVGGRGAGGEGWSCEAGDFTFACEDTHVTPSLNPVSIVTCNHGNIQPEYNRHRQTQVESF